MTNQDLIDENARLINAINILSAELHETQLSMRDILDNLALTNAELSNLRAWRAAALKEKIENFHLTH